MINIGMLKSLDEVKQIIMNNDRVMVKFSAGWCVPCKMIKTVCEGNFNKMTEDGVVCLNVDIDDEMDFYMLLKQKKQVTSIPSLCYYYGEKSEDTWFVPREIYAGSKLPEVQGFFDKCGKLRE